MFDNIVRTFSVRVRRLVLSDYAGSQAMLELTHGCTSSAAGAENEGADKRQVDLDAECLGVRIHGSSWIGGLRPRSSITYNLVFSF